MSVKTIRLGPKLKVPAVELATQVVACLGMRGSGKSNSVAVMVEGLLRHSVQVVVLDYVGIWFSLRLSHDPRLPSPFRIPVLGGRHGDVPLASQAGRVVAEALAKSESAAVLDVSGFSKGDRAKFGTDFAEAFFQAKKQHPSPCFLVLEEAQRWVPQKLFKGQERMLGAFEEIAEVGRNYGVGLGLISQRPQKINKDVLNLTELLLAFQTNGVLERKAIAEWVQEKDAEGRTEVNDELPSLRRGTAIVWSPSWLELYGKYALDKKTTYDAGATPTATSASVEVVKLDLDELKKAMATVVEQAAESNPKQLVAEVARLKAKLVALESGRSSGDGGSSEIRRLMRENERLNKIAQDRRNAFEKISKNKRPVGVSIPEGAFDLLELVGKSLDASIPNLVNIVNCLEDVIRSVKGIYPGVRMDSSNLAKARKDLLRWRGSLVRWVVQPPLATGADASASSKPSRAAAALGIKIKGGSFREVDDERFPPGVDAMIDALAMSYIDLTRQQLRTLSGLKASGTFKKYVSIMRTNGFVEVVDGGKFRLTEKGRGRAGPDKRPKGGRELLEFWKQSLPGKSGDMLEYVVANGETSRDELLSAVGVANSGTAKKYISIIVSRGLVTQPDRSTLAPAEMFSEMT